MNHCPLKQNNPKVRETLTEEEIADGIIQGSNRVYNYVYQRYNNALRAKIITTMGFRYLSHIDDILQEAYYKIYIYRMQYNPKKGKLYTWMLNIAKNAAIDFLRSKFATLISKEKKIDNIWYAADNTNIIINRIDVITLLSRLQRQERKIMAMKYLHEFTGDEVAEEMQLPAGSVKTIVRRVCLRFRNLN